MNNISFVAIDFETATNRLDSICEAGICVVKNGIIVKKESWLVQPEDNFYNYWNMRIHGIHPEDTEDAPPFPEIWEEILCKLEETPILVAHNASFDMGCIRHTCKMYQLDVPEIRYYCTLKTARKIYSFKSNTLDSLCNNFNIDLGTHHRAGDDAESCARLFLQEIKDANIETLEEFEEFGGWL